MNVKLDDGPVQVTLSRRNLLELLAELDELRAGGALMPPNSRALLSRRIPLGRLDEDGSIDGIFLTVEAQEDDVHYGDRTPGTRGMLNP